MAPRPQAEALAFFRGLAPSTIRLGLSRVEAALVALNQPERRFPSVHVAGTNGKGSTCAFISSVLQKQGYRVGLYTSPHLVRVNERINVGGADISDPMLARRIDEVLDRLPQMLEADPPLTFFEFGTVVALWHFAEEAVDIAVLETGLGGRLDATNVVTPLVTAISVISLDHQRYLGDTLEEIAAEKAGIFKPGIPAVASAQAPEVAAVLRRMAARVGAPLRLGGEDFWVEPESSGQTLRYQSAERSLGGWRPGLRGAHQIHNAALAIATLEAVGRTLSLSEESIRLGLASTQWPGRLEQWGVAPPLLLDGAHNPGGIEALVAALNSLYPARKVHLVFGVFSDKDFRPMIESLFPRCTSIHLAPIASPRSVAPREYLAEARALCAQTQSYDSVERWHVAG